MDLRHLRYFIAIVEEGSFSEAARNRLSTSQPSLSRQIGELETELGVTLLDRGANGVKPTASGLIFFDHARRILERVQHAIDATRDSERLVRVGCLPGLEQKVMTKLREIGASRSTAPEFQVVSGFSLMLHEHIRAGLLDVAFVWPDDEGSDLCSTIVGHQEIVALILAAHPLACAKSIGVKELRDQVCISMSPKIVPAFWLTTESWFERGGFKLTPTHFANSFISAISLIRSTGGFMLMPEYARSLVPAEFAVLHLKKPPSITINLIHRPTNRTAVGWIIDAMAERWDQPDT